MKFFLLPAVYCLLTISVFAQKTAYNSKIIYSYFDKEWGEIPSMEGAAFVRVFMGVDSVRAYYEVRDYTIGGMLLSSICSSSTEYLMPEGPATWYNDKRKPWRKGQFKDGGPVGQWTDFYYNGQMESQYRFTVAEGQAAPQKAILFTENSWDSTGHAEVIAGNGVYQERNDTTGEITGKGMIKEGRKDGVWQGFNKSGEKEYEEEYAGGKFIKGIRFDAGGQQMAYDKLLVLPAYPGGEDALGKFLSKNIKYPRSAQEKGYSGTVLVKFTVNADGTISGVAISAGVDKSLNEEALRVVRSMPAWTPGKHRGLEEAMGFRLPIRFNLVN